MQSSICCSTSCGRTSNGHNIALTRLGKTTVQMIGLSEQCVRTKENDSKRASECCVLQCVKMVSISRIPDVQEQQ